MTLMTLKSVPARYKFPSIEQFRHTIHQIRHRSSYAGDDANGYPIYKEEFNCPTLKFYGTVKLHGTNVSVGNEKAGGELFIQSRSTTITSQKDNYGFARFVEEAKAIWETNIARWRHLLSVPVNEPFIVYAEWCGQGIQSTVAISTLPKMCVILSARWGVGNDTKWSNLHALPLMEPVDPRFKNIYDYPVYSLDIDFNDPGLQQNEIVKLVQAVEDCCPVGKALGVEGTGEGIVWRCFEPGYEDTKFWFKTKGDKHSATKVKTIAPVDLEKVASVKEFATNTVTPHRLQQGLDYLTETGSEHSKRSTGAFLKWLANDIHKEEADVLAASGLAPKDVNNLISRLGREWFFNYLNTSF